MDCLLEGRDAFAVMPTSFGKSFFFSCSSQRSNKKIFESVILVICPVIGLIEDQIKEGQPIGLTCASVQDVNSLFSDNPLPQLLFASAENALDNDFKRILREIFKGSPTS